MVTRRLVGALVSVVLGCSKGEEAVVAPVAAPGVSAARTVAVVGASPSASAPSASAGESGAMPGRKGATKKEAGVEPRVGREALRVHVRELAEGRKLAQAKKWSEAMARYEEALKARPEDPRVLAEMGYASLHGGELERARGFHRRALRGATEPGLRASILFNEGMVEEKKGEVDAARRHYEASLALRPSAIVQGRLEKLGGQGCDARFPSRKALEECMRQREAPDLFLRDPKGAVFFAEEGRDKSGLVVLQWGQQDGPEHPYFLMAEGAWGARRLALLGSDYEPGAFGVHNKGRFERFERRKIGAREVVLVWWGQSNHDSNMAGLQTDSYESRNLTVCVLPEAPGEPRCPVSIPLEETTENSYMEVEEGGEDWNLVEEMKRERPPFRTTHKATFSLDDAGVFRVSETSGQRPHLAPYARGVKVF
ncbi:MAG: tetratricopeptide repeat protein [Polyangiaceae bacterium]|nr:tetratricopeptide repeat protein [Polyangiaceae bacterium]